jgi:hypothetical protein
MRIIEAVLFWFAASAIMFASVVVLLNHVIV